MLNIRFIFRLPPINMAIHAINIIYLSFVVFFVVILNCQTVKLKIERNIRNFAELEEALTHMVVNPIPCDQMVSEFKRIIVFYNHTRRALLPDLYKGICEKIQKS